MCDACDNPTFDHADAGRDHVGRDHLVDRPLGDPEHAVEHASNTPLEHHRGHGRRLLDRRSLLRFAGAGGAAAAATLWLPERRPARARDTFRDRGAGRGPAQRAGCGRARCGAGRRPRWRQKPSTKSTPQVRIPTPAIVSRADWGANESIRTTERGFAPIRKFVVHHTASANNPKNPMQVVRDMYRYHVVGRGFSDVGYNFAIDHKGTIYEGRWARDYGSNEVHDGEGEDGYGVVGAHALGVNAGSCGIVLIGDFTKGSPTKAAVASLIHLIAWKAAGTASTASAPSSTSRSTAPGARSRTSLGTARPARRVSRGPCYEQLPRIRESVAVWAGRYPGHTVDQSKTLRWTVVAPRGQQARRQRPWPPRSGRS